MSTKIIQKQEIIQIQPSHLQGTDKERIAKQLPDSVVNKIFCFTPERHLMHHTRLVSKQWRELFSTNGVLDLQSSSITDEGLIELIEKYQKQITHVNLDACLSITDKGIKSLAKLQNLKTLSLSGCEITDAGIKYLSTLQTLTTIDLSYCDKIKDAGVKDLSSLQNLTEINLDGCENITDAGVKDLSTLQKLTTVNLSRCYNITDKGVRSLSLLQNLTKLFLEYCGKITNAGIKDLAALQNLTELDLLGCGKITTGVKELGIIRQIIAEKTLIEEFLNEKSQKNRILKCEPQFKDEHEMSCTPLLTGFRININFLYLLAEKNMDSFLLQKPDVQKSVKTFLVQKKPELIEEAATDLIEWFNSNTLHKVAINNSNKLLAKELLIMHGIGKLSAMKRFLLTHEMGHAHDHEASTSLGDFNPADLDFIESHQYGEVRADLTAAREEHAHELGIIYFEWRNIIAPQPLDSDAHPTDANRAKAIKIDRDKILRETINS